MRFKVAFKNPFTKGFYGIGFAWRNKNFHQEALE